MTISCLSLFNLRLSPKPKEHYFPDKYKQFFSRQRIGFILLKCKQIRQIILHLTLNFDVFKQKMKTEAELIANVKAGMASAFDLIFGMYSHKIYYFAFSILKSKEDAEDVVQHTFFKLWEKRESLNNSLVFKPFLFTIAYNVSIDLLRSRLKEKGYRENILVQASSNYNLEERIEYGDLLDRINQISEKLPPRKKEIYQLSRVHHLSHSEIAEKLNISVKTVENGIGYSLKFIKTHLGNDPVLGLLLAWLLL